MYKYLYHQKYRYYRYFLQVYRFYTGNTGNTGKYRKIQVLQVSGMPGNTDESEDCDLRNLNFYAKHVNWNSINDDINLVQWESIYKKKIL